MIFNSLKFQSIFILTLLIWIIYLNSRPTKYKNYDGFLFHPNNTLEGRNYDRQILQELYRNVYYDSCSRKRTESTFQDPIFCEIWRESSVEPIMKGQQLQSAVNTVERYDHATFETLNQICLIVNTEFDWSSAIEVLHFSDFKGKGNFQIISGNTIIKRRCKLLLYRFSPGNWSFYNMFHILDRQFTTFADAGKIFPEIRIIPYLSQESLSDLPADLRRIIYYQLMRHLIPMVFLTKDVDKPLLETSDSRVLFTIGKAIIKQCSHILIVLTSSQSLNSHWRHVSLSETCDKFINTRKHHPECFPKPKRLYPMLVTGLGGTGTHFIANSLQELGFDLAHEGIGRDGAVSWLYAVNDHLINSSYPFGRVDGGFLSPRFSNVIHVMRDPLQQISAFTSHSNKSYEFVSRMIEETLVIHGNERVYRNFLHKLHDPNRLLEMHKVARSQRKHCYRGEDCNLYFSTLSWYFWNMYVESYADKRFLISDAEGILNSVCLLLWHEVDSTMGSDCVSRRKASISDSFHRLYHTLRRKHYFARSVHRKHLAYTLASLRLHQIPQLLVDWIVAVAKRSDLPF